jgi:hypothetical protein
MMSNSDYSGIMVLASRMKSLTKEAFYEYASIVNSIINEKSREKIALNILLMAYSIFVLMIIF